MMAGADLDDGRTTTRIKNREIKTARFKILYPKIVILPLIKIKNLAKTCMPYN